MLVARVDSLQIKIPLCNLDYLVGIKVYRIKKDMFKPSKQEKDEFNQVTGRSYKTVARASSIYLLYSERGVVFTAIEWKRSGFFIVSFHGLQQYQRDGKKLTDLSVQSRRACIELMCQLGKFILHRIDYAIDESKFRMSIYKSIASKREFRLFRGTRYYQPIGQRIKENPSLKIMIYDKQICNNLIPKMMRLEFGIKSSYLKNIPKLTMKDFDQAIIVRGESIIKR
jgi:hypothetical protein